MSMPKAKKVRNAVIATVVALGLGVGGVFAYRMANAGPGTEFVSRDGATFMLDGKPFAFAGTNNYRPMFSGTEIVDKIMAATADNHFQVLRTWAFNDIGRQDGTDSVDPSNTTKYFHYWDGKQPAFNDGEDGLKMLDYVIASAKKHNVKLILPLVNNWGPFGGMDQYVRWAGLTYHSDFYTDAKVRQWYKDWASHLLNRVNTITGVKYKDDPTIMAWELANEPRCAASGTYQPNPSCNTDTITAWAKEMSGYVRSVDGNHLIGLGDEGFICDPAGNDWTLDCSQGVDARAIAALDNIDMVGLHLYPDWWKHDAAWSTEYIKKHLAIGDEFKKPVFLGEYGWKGTTTRNVVFKQWLDAFQAGGGDGANFWMMQPHDESYNPSDLDGFTVYCPSPVCTQVANRSVSMGGGASDFAPVADGDSEATAFGKPVAVDVLKDDISYGSALDPATIDLDPKTDGVQATLTLPEGVLTASADGIVTATPAAGFSGSIEASYTVSDTSGKVSNVADLSVNVAAAS